MNLLVFDSGIGGLGVVAQIRCLQPQAGVIYLADNGFYPYGEKADAVLIARILRVVGAGLRAIRPAAAVIACNTASTVALERLRAEFALPFIGCVPPVKPAAAASRSRHIGLLATPATLRRPYLAQLIRDFAGDCVVHSHGTPLLADLAERKFRGQAVDLEALAGAIRPLLAQPGAEEIDSIALGCTHYTFLLPELRLLHPRMQWSDPAGPVARQTQRVTQGLPGTSPPGPGRVFFTAPPADAAFLETALAAYGFAGIEALPPDALSRSG